MEKGVRLGEILSLSIFFLVVAFLMFWKISGIVEKYEKIKGVNQMPKKMVKIVTLPPKKRVPPPAHAEINNVPIFAQFPTLPTGCEATATAMLLNWAGVKVSKEEVARVLPKGPLPYAKVNRVYGGNPNMVFVGNPFSTSGYGIFHQPIARILNHYLPGSALDLTGCEFEELLKVVGNGKPILVWATINMMPTYVSHTWYDEMGQRVDWKINEHCLVLVGYDSQNVFVNDPYLGRKKAYPISAFKKMWMEMGRQAVTLTNT